MDLGAESGRCIVGVLSNGAVALRDGHRFPNEPVALPDGLHWDALRLFHDLTAGLRRAARDGPLAGMGVATWGVDFALLDRDGALLGNPYHYRDRRTEGILDDALRLITRDELFRRTGGQPMRINTLFQLFAMARARAAALEAAATLLMMPDLFNYWLAGEVGCEFTEATTSQCYDLRTGAWAVDLVERLGIPPRIFPRVFAPATVLGPLRRGIAEGAGCGDLRVIAAACHDTASAVAAVPAEDPAFAYISSGTWSLVGTEVGRPVVTPEALAHGFTNEGGALGRVCFLKNVTGLWLLQACRSWWAAEGEDVSYDALVGEAEAASSVGAFVNPDDERFLGPGDMPARLRRACRETGQPVPQTRGELVRCIIESLALRYRWVLDRLDRILGRPTPVVHIVGGGARNALLCRLTADVTGRTVEAGPVEATAMGNVLTQACALGRLDPRDVRAVARRSAWPVVYEPRDHARWADASERFGRLVAQQEGQP